MGGLLRKDVTQRLSSQDQKTYETSRANIEKASQELSERYGISKEDARRISATGTLNWQVGGAAGKLYETTTGVSLNLAAQAGTEAKWSEAQVKDDVNRILTENNVSESYKNLANLTASTDTTNADGTTSTDSNSVSAKLDDAKRYEEQSQASFRSENSYRQAAQLAKSDGFQFSQDQQQNYLDWLQDEKGMSFNDAKELQRPENYKQNVAHAKEFINAHSDDFLKPYLDRLENRSAQAPVGDFKQPNLKQDYHQQRTELRGDSDVKADYQSKQQEAE